MILGIETSCDETAAAVVEDGYKLLSTVVASSAEIHVKYGGVVPEVAARHQIESIIPVIEEALTQAKITWAQIDGIAVTYGAGLGGSLLIGVLAARTLAIVYGKPLYAINHIEAHVYASFITSASPSLSGLSLPSASPKFPILSLIVSGKHTELVLFRDHFDYTVLGQTQDDAVGEAFDKVAKMLGLPYPGGPSINQTATAGDAHAFQLPKAKLESKYDFSFSGLKTAVLRLAQTQIGEDYTFPSIKLSQRLSEAQKADIAASFQRTAIETVVEKTSLAYQQFLPASVIMAGGVAANPELRRELANTLPCSITYPDVMLCTDNAAMVAALGSFKAMRQQAVADPYSLDIVPNLSM